MVRGSIPDPTLSAAIRENRGSFSRSEITGACARHVGHQSACTRTRIGLPAFCRASKPALSKGWPTCGPQKLNQNAYQGQIVVMVEATEYRFDAQTSGTTDLVPAARGLCW